MKDILRFKKVIMKNFADIILIDLDCGIDYFDLEERTMECYCNTLLDCTRDEVESLLGYDILELADDELKEEFGYQQNKILIELSEEQIYKLLKQFFKQILEYDDGVFFGKYPNYDTDDEYFEKYFKISKKEFEEFFNIQIDMSNYR